MAEYIDREFAIEGMWAGLESGSICGPEDTERFLRSLPAADAEQVRHGRWKKEPSGCVICSECGEEHSWIDYRASYCEDCGAKMDGEVEG